MRISMSFLPLLLLSVLQACLLQRACAAEARGAGPSLLGSAMKMGSSALKFGAGMSRGLSATVTDKEACVGCRFVWAKTNAILDESAGYEAVKDAFERTCAHMPDVFYDSCDKMFENEDRLIQEYLDGKSFNDMCEAVLLCAPGMLTSIRKVEVQKGGFPANQVRFTEHCNFDGWDKRFGTGDLPDVGKAGMSSGISAVQVGAGVKLIMYTESNYKGEKKEYTGPTTVDCLVKDGWNDRCRSLKIVSK